MVRRGIVLKTSREIAVMAEGGKKLARVKQALFEAVKVGVDAFEIDKLAEELILKEGGEASFKRVPNYFWTTCINVNDGIVHGIPKKEIVFKKGDVVSVDVGIFYKGFHTDTSFSKGLNLDRETSEFLEAGKIALKEAISKAKVGNRIFDISEVIEDRIKGKGYFPVTRLVGHGVGRDLHEDPQIPCIVYGMREESLKIPEGAVLAIEVMYGKGTGEIKILDDGWTIASADGKMTALFEDTIAITKSGPVVLTD